MILALLVLKLQLTSHPGGGHFGFCQYGGPVKHPSWRPSEMQTACHGPPLGQIWCLWKNLNQNSPNNPDYKESMFNYRNWQVSWSCCNIAWSDRLVSPGVSQSTLAMTRSPIPTRNDLFVVVKLVL